MKICFAICLVSSLAFANNAFATDLVNSDIAGVRLGMTEAESIVAIRNHYGKDARIQKLVGTSIIDNRAMVRIISVSDGIYELRIVLAERVPPKLPVVESINLTWDRTKATDADLRQFNNSVLEKYGQPTTDPKFTPILWCTKPRQITDNSRAVSTICDGPQPILQFDIGPNGDGLTLADTSIIDNDGIRQYIESRKHTGPHL